MPCKTPLILIPSDPKPTGGLRVRFIDYDGKIMRTHWVASGENALPPPLPNYSQPSNMRPALTFQGWNWDITNVQHPIDCGAMWIPADGKTHAYLTLTPITGLILPFYLDTAEAGTLTFEWGDGSSDTTDSTVGFLTVSHTFPDYGNYIVKISRSAGTYAFANEATTTTFVGGGAQEKRNALTAIYVGEKVTRTGTCAFYNCHSLTHVTIPLGITQIQVQAFESCRSLTNVIIPSGVLELFLHSFFLSLSLSSVIIPSSVIAIGYNLLYQCYSLRSVIIPAGVTTIATGTFYQCFAAKEYIFLCETTPTLANIDALQNISDIGKIYVLDALVAGYKAAANWSTYADYIYPLSSMEA
jgi:hypothetical protein